MSITAQKWKSLAEDRPEPYDMIEMEVLIRGRKKRFFGWWTGSSWFTTQLKNDFTPIRWKRSEANFY